METPILVIWISAAIGIAAAVISVIALIHANKKPKPYVCVPAKATAPVTLDEATGEIALVKDPVFASTVTGSNFNLPGFAFPNEVLYAAEDFRSTWSGFSVSVPAHFTLFRVGQVVTMVLKPFNYPSTETNITPFIGRNPAGWSPKSDILVPVIANHNNAYVQCTMKINTNMTIYIYGPIFSNGINTTSGGLSFPLDLCATWPMSI